MVRTLCSFVLEECDVEVTPDGIGEWGGGGSGGGVHGSAVVTG